MTDDSIATFQQRLRGSLVRQGDGEYDAVRALYNGMIDKRPRLIARCADVADVIAAVNFGREQQLLIAIRGGGHSGPGLGSCNDGLMIDLSLMKGRRVDPERRTVRIDAGCTSGDVDHATAAFGLMLAARPAMSIMPPTRSDWPCHLASSRQPASRASPSAGAPGTSHASTASRLITCSKRTLSWPAAILSRPAKASTLISSGRCAGEVATLAW